MLFKWIPRGVLAESRDSDFNKSPPAQPVCVPRPLTMLAAARSNEWYAKWISYAYGVEMVMHVIIIILTSPRSRTQCDVVVAHHRPILRSRKRCIRKKVHLQFNRWRGVGCIRNRLHYCRSCSQWKQIINLLWLVVVSQLSVYRATLNG